MGARCILHRVVLMDSLSYGTPQVDFPSRHKRQYHASGQ